MKFKIKRKFNHLTYDNGDLSCLISFSKNKQKYFWLCFSNRKHRENIWGKNHCQSKPHFCLSIPKIITLDTAHVGKNLWGRLNLMQLFGKDYTVYTSGESTNECTC